jgi:hypothetical protein
MGNAAATAMYAMIVGKSFMIERAWNRRTLCAFGGRYVSAYNEKALSSVLSSVYAMVCRISYILFQSLFTLVIFGVEEGKEVGLERCAWCFRPPARTDRDPMWSLSQG